MLCGDFDLKFQNKEIDESKDESLVQVDLPFNQVQDNNQKTRLKYKLPAIDFLKLPTKKEREKSTSEYKIDESTLEKILLCLYKYVDLVKRDNVIDLYHDLKEQHDKL